MRWSPLAYPKAVAVFAGILLSAPSAMASGDGRAIYNFRCYYCHGYSGDAQTLASTYLTPPPISFQAQSAATMPLERILAAVRDGRPGTAMQPFRHTIDAGEIRAVSQFVFDTFVVGKQENTRYHTPENGWPRHERYKIAYPFATGEIPLTAPWESLSPEQSRGKRLFLQSCVSCHDRGRLVPDEIAWDARPLSYPRNFFSFNAPPKVDAIASASPYAKHDVPLKLTGMTPAEKRGEKLYQDNCAFCHAANGTGKNWIGQFLEPHPRNLQDKAFMAGQTREMLLQKVREGLPGTSMPAWKDVLTDGEIGAIIDYVGRAFHPLPAWKNRP